MLNLVNRVTKTLFENVMSSIGLEEQNDLKTELVKRGIVRNVTIITVYVRYLKNFRKKGFETSVCLFWYPYNFMSIQLKSFLSY